MYVGHIPGIWTCDWKPIVEALDFLISKATGEFTAGGHLSPYALPQPLSENSMLAVGYDLTDFFDWVEKRSFDWKNDGSRFLLHAYRMDLKSGHWSKRVTGPLSEATIKRRVQTATQFLSHSGAKVGTWSEQLSRPVPNTLPSLKRGRQNVRQHPRRLRLPTLTEIAAWLGEMKSLHGTTPYLMCKSIFALGLRSSEVIGLRVAQIPPVPTNNQNSIGLDVCYGTKGLRTPGDPQRRGKERTIRISVSYLKELHTYISIDRKRALQTFRTKSPGAAAPKELFLSKHTGRPLTYSRFYELWRSPSPPFRHFSPHLGRHTWACYTLLEKIRNEVDFLQESRNVFAPAIGSLGSSLIDIWITPQLGHVSSATTNLYLNWIGTAVDSECFVRSWFDHLDG